jgi:hypothetical protein
MLGQMSLGLCNGAEWHCGSMKASEQISVMLSVSARGIDYTVNLPSIASPSLGATHSMREMPLCCEYADMLSSSPSSTLHPMSAARARRCQIASAFTAQAAEIRCSEGKLHASNIDFATSTTAFW